MYMSSMDLYDVEARVWLRSRAVPGGGCVIAACAAVGFIYVLTSHAVEMSFWRFDARRRHGGFGEWSRMKTPLDGSIKFSLVGVGNKVMLALMKNGRVLRASDERFVWIYDTVAGDWSCIFKFI
ncbi:F-box/kelch-repeat protein [Citrus sinensis]|nr:F-box/kelch-repeat protein [Citrus sinensis]